MGRWRTAIEVGGAALFAFALAFPLPAAVATTDPSPVTGMFAPVPGGFVPMTPTRVVDTRQSPSPSLLNAGPRLSGGVARSFLVVPPSGSIAPLARVGAVAVNITVISGSGAGYASMWTAGTPQPSTSVINFAADRPTANGAVVRPSPDGRVMIMSSTSANVIVDVVGWYARQPALAAQGGGFSAITPTRLVDTRSQTRLGDGETRRARVYYPNQPPAGGVVAAVLNVVATDAAQAGWLSVWPSGAPQPNTSSLNYGSGQTVSNQILVKVGGSGEVDYFSSRRANIIIDMVGYFTAGPTGPGGFVAMDPVRIMDTRTADGNYGYDTTINAFTLIVGGSKGVPRAAGAVALNVTAVLPHSPGYLTVWPDGVTRPTSSVSNPWPGVVVANGATIGLGPLKGVHLYRDSDPDLIVDVTGWFTSPSI